MRFIAVLFAALVVISATGCVQRYLVVKAEPGTQVWIDGKLVGETKRVLEDSPAEIRLPFDHYGVRGVVLRRYGCYSKTGKLPCHAPWYQYFPLDLVFELFMPFYLTDEHVFEFKLDEIDEIDTDTILERAEVFKGRLKDFHRFFHRLGSHHCHHRAYARGLSHLAGIAANSLQRTAGTICHGLLWRRNPAAPPAEHPPDK